MIVIGKEVKFNLSDTHISWKGYLIGSLTPKISIHLMAYKKNRQYEDVYRQKSYFHFRSGITPKYVSFNTYLTESINIEIDMLVLILT
jgi:hypothetical protein